MIFVVQKLFSMQSAPWERDRRPCAHLSPPIAVRRARSNATIPHERRRAVATGRSGPGVKRTLWHAGSGTTPVFPPLARPALWSYTTLIDTIMMRFSAFGSNGASRWVCLWSFLTAAPRPLLPRHRSSMAKTIRSCSKCSLEYNAHLRFDGTHAAKGSTGALPSPMQTVLMPLYPIT